jgi:hypothetical protein
VVLIVTYATLLPVEIVKPVVSSATVELRGNAVE